MRHFRSNGQGVAYQLDTFGECCWVRESKYLDEGHLVTCLDVYSWRHILMILFNWILFTCTAVIKFFLWKELLWPRRLLYAHFHISITKVGIPNNIPRYYGVAVLSLKENNVRVDSFQKLFFPKQVASDKGSEQSVDTHTPYLGKNIIATPPIS